MQPDHPTAPAAPPTTSTSGSASKLALLVNAGGGSADDDRIAAVRAAMDAAGLECSLYESEGDPTDEARRAVRDGCPTLVACGGDGTVGAIAAVAVEAGVVLGVIPMGTLNHFARDLGIPDDPAEAVDVVRAGAVRAVDVGMAGELLFINNASVGAYARLVAHREHLEQRMGKLRALMAAMRTVVPHRPIPVELDIDGERLEMHATLVFFGNNDYVVEDGRFTRSSLDDGFVSVYAISAERRRDLLRIAVRAALNRVGRERDMVHRTGHRITLSATSTSTLLAHDGEVEPVALPLTVEIRPGALQVLAPPRPPRTSPTSAKHEDD